MYRLSFLFLIVSQFSLGQNFTSYFTGNTSDIVTNPLGGVCLMGGATEDDNAMIWFLEKANEGDVLVLRTSGSDGYNDYMYSSLGVTINSVETIVCNNALASNDPYIHEKIQNAEAIWFAGGDQWNYVSYWRNTPVDSLINIAIDERNIVIGGTSAGMAIQGSYYFSAQNGTVTSAQAVANPYNNNITVDSTEFLINDQLNEVITDTHFDDPDRKGRLMTFLARINTDYGILGKAIACDEYTSVCIDTSGIAYVYGGYPTYDDNAYFIQSNCELTSPSPENCSNGVPLNWDLGGSAIKAYRIKGISTGMNTFDLNNWQDGIGGDWLDWSVSNGTFSEQSGADLTCSVLSNINLLGSLEIEISPNPTTDCITIAGLDNELNDYVVKLVSLSGHSLLVDVTITSNNSLKIDLTNLNTGVYILNIGSDGTGYVSRKVIKN